MPAVPSKIEYVFTVMDAHGDTATVRFPAYQADISTSALTLAALYGAASALSTALASCIRGKIVLSGMTFHWSRAQKPNGPLAEYPLVEQAAMLNFGDGGLERTRVSLPTPRSDVFQSDGRTVDTSNTNVAALIAAVEANCVAPSTISYNEYLGGRFKEAKPRRRTNLYNGTA